MKTAASQPRRVPLLVATLAAAMLVAVAQGGAQAERTSSGLFKAHPQKRAEPVRIASLSLDVRDKSKLATFSGNVHIIQGELALRSNTLLVFYDDMSGVKKVGGQWPQPAADPAHGSARRGHHHPEGTSAPPADQADFDMLGNKFTLNGNVVVTKCEDVMRGERLVRRYDDRHLPDGRTGPRRA